MRVLLVSGLIVLIALGVLACGPTGPVGRILFISDRDGAAEIYVMDADGSNQTRLTDGPFAFFPPPVWSPDGSKIAFSAESFADSASELGLYVMKADGSEMTRLADGCCPAWSPDSTKISFSDSPSTRGAFPTRELWVINADGSNRAKLTGHSVDKLNSGSSAWSPDGTQIVYIAGEIDKSFAADFLDPQLYVIDANGSNKTQLVHVGTNYAPSWSPDGTKIAFFGDEPGTVYVMEADGSNQARLTDAPFGLVDAPHSVFPPVWSPDGTKIIFAAFTERDDVHIYLMNADGTKLTSLLSGLFGFSHGYGLDWSPDGSQIVFTWGTTHDQAEIYVMDADGSNLTNLTNNAARDLIPVWGPR